MVLPAIAMVLPAIATDIPNATRAEIHQSSLLHGQLCIVPVSDPLREGQGSAALRALEHPHAPHAVWGEEVIEPDEALLQIGFQPEAGEQVLAAPQNLSRARYADQDHICKSCNWSQNTS